MPGKVFPLDDVSFPMACPACEARAGQPYRAGTSIDTGGVQVALRCGLCKHEWLFDMPVRVDDET